MENRSIYEKARVSIMIYPKYNSSPAEGLPTKTPKPTKLPGSEAP